jgi:uncharacterized protein (DUF433 family)
MTTLVSELPEEAWRRRMYLPNYQIGEAARYADISAQTVATWHKGGDGARTLSTKELRAALSYMQLIEVAVVAAFRRAGVKLRVVRAAREYASRIFKKEFPFSEYRFKTDGKDLLMDYEQIEGSKGKGKLLIANRDGQLAWSEIIGTLKSFEYDDDGVVVRWHLAGETSPVFIDPRIAFGAPTVSGTPTWIIKDRWNVGESVDDIADDFGLKKTEVKKALQFEGIGANAKRGTMWVH